MSDAEFNAPPVNVMVDVEALALRAGAAIIQIGAVTFDISSGEVHEEFSCLVRPSPPFVADLETIEWNQKRGNLLIHPDAVEPAEAVLQFLTWLDVVAPVPTSRVMWSWGSDYDFPILAPYIDLRGPGVAEPWRYHQQRCARTVWKLAHNNARSPERPHAAIEDARSTVRDLVSAIELLRAR